MRRQSVLVSAVLCLAPSVVLGDLIYVDTGDGTVPPSYLLKGRNSQGWVADGVGHMAHTNYYTGLSSTGVLRSFFTFLLTGIEGTVTSARLELSRFEYRSSADKEVVGFYDVESDPADVFAETYSGGIPLPVHDAATLAMISAVYEDLGSGILYGTMEILKDGDEQDLLSCVLSDEAVSKINSLRGTTEYFIIGGALLTLDGSVSETIPSAEAVFSSSGSYTYDPWACQRLALEVAPIPLPGAVLLGMIGLGCAGIRLRRERI